MKSFQEIANQSLEEAKKRKGEDNQKLIEQLKNINEQIANYPTPIAGCDAQFNFLLEEKERISKIINSRAARDGIFNHIFHQIKNHLAASLKT